MMNTKGLTVSLAGLLAVSLLGTGRSAPTQAHGGKPPPTAARVWQPDPTLFNQLGPGTHVERYFVRPPQGYSFLQNKQGALRAYLWKGPERQDGTSPGLFIVLATPPASARRSLTAEKALASFLQNQRHRRVNFSASPPELGVVNGIPFVRSYWRGQDKQRGFPMHGWAYAAVDRGQLISLGSQDVDTAGRQSLDLAEAAALTFHK